jgi:hypothetical protein
VGGGKRISQGRLEDGLINSQLLVVVDPGKPSQINKQIKGKSLSIPPPMQTLHPHTIFFLNKFFLTL